MEFAWNNLKVEQQTETTRRLNRKQAMARWRIRFSLRVLLIAAALIALALAIWFPRHVRVTLRTANLNNPIEITLDTRRLLSLVDLRLPHGSNRCLIWRADPSWQVFDSPDEHRWVNPWRRGGGLSTVRLIDGWKSRRAVFAAGYDSDWVAMINWNDSARWPRFAFWVYSPPNAPKPLLLRVFLTPRAASRVGPVFPARFFLTAALTHAVVPVRQTGGFLERGGTHREFRSFPLPTGDSDGYALRIPLSPLVVLRNEKDILGICVYDRAHMGRVVGSIEWDRDRRCPVVAWRVKSFGLWSGGRTVQAGEIVSAEFAVFGQSEADLANLASLWGDAWPPPPSNLGRETPLAVWRLPDAIRPYPEIRMPGGPGASVSLLAPRGGSDVATLYVQTQATQEVHVHAVPDWLSLEATRCVDIDALQDPDGALGPTPEILIPISPERPIGVTLAGQGILLTAHVPRGATAHALSTEVIFSSASGEVRVPVTVEVAAWDLPPRPTLRSAFELHARDLRDSSPTGLRRWAEAFAQNRLSIAYATPPRISVAWDGDVTANWTAFDAGLSLTLDELGMNTFFVPFGLFGVHGEERGPQGIEIGRYLGMRPGPSAWRGAWSSYLRALRQHLRDRDWLDRAVLFLWDEPNAAEERSAVYATCAQLAGIAQQEAPEIPLYISTTVTIPELERQWPASVEAAVNIDGLADLPRDGRRRWLTLDGEERSWITGDLDRIRAVPRVAWAFDLEGIELWAVNAWRDQRMRQPGLLDPIDTSSLAPLGPLMAAEIGGQLLFQDAAGQPLRSLAWATLGQGMEDVDILNALKQVDPVRAEEIAEEIRQTATAEQPRWQSPREWRAEALHLLSAGGASPERSD
jgi:hypothetical protein